MRKIFGLTLAYMRYYKKQALVMLIGIILSAMLLSGIGSLIYSGQMADLENAREQYGDWHYSISLENISENFNSETLKNRSVLTVKKIVDEPYTLSFCTVDVEYMKMMGRSLTAGKYPQKSGEIALDYHTINNIGADDEIGSQIEIDGEFYTLCGIVTDGCDSNDMKVFVSEDTELDGEMTTTYLKFDESECVYKQLKSFAKEYGLNAVNFEHNSEVTKYVGGETKESFISIAQAAFSNSDAGLVYFIGSLNESYGLMEKVVFIALAVFGAFIIYSLFNVTVVKRRSQYAVLQVIGLESNHMFMVMLTELLLTAVLGYPIGCVLGNVTAKLIYSNIGTIFSNGSESTRFFLSVPSIVNGALLLFFFIIVISFMMISEMRKHTDIQMIRKDVKERSFKRKIYAKRSRDLTKLLTKRFMFGRFRTFAGMIVSLSLGGIIFLSTAYTAECTVKNNEHTLKTDDGLGSDINVFIDSDNGSYTIAKNAAEKISLINDVLWADKTSYLLGEIPLENGRFMWTEYYPETSEIPGEKQDKRILDNYNGIIIKQSEDSYRLKVNVYGYSDSMTDALNDYLLEGEIDSQLLKEENSVILKTLTDGQGNTDGIDIGVGDTIVLKVPKTMNSSEVLKFNSNDSEYIVKEFTVAAVVNRPIAKNKNFIGDDGTSTVDIIMTNDQMEKNFGVDSYNSVSVNLNDNANTDEVMYEIRLAVNGLNHCTVKDFTEEIRRKNIELRQKVSFFYGIAAILLCISLLHIINSMRFIILSRRKEFGIIRAMGITNNKFIHMLLHEGIRYGIYTSIFMTAIYLMIHQILRYIMTKVFLYIIVEGNIMLAQCIIMSLVNVILCISAIFITGKELLKEDIINEMYE